MPQSSPVCPDPDKQPTPEAGMPLAPAVVCPSQGRNAPPQLRTARPSLERPALSWACPAPARDAPPPTGRYRRGSASIQQQSRLVLRATSNLPTRARARTPPMAGPRVTESSPTSLIHSSTLPPAPGDSSTHPGDRQATLLFNIAHTKKEDSMESRFGGFS